MLRSTVRRYSKARHSHEGSGSGNVGGSEAVAVKGLPTRRYVHLEGLVGLRRLLNAQVPEQFSKGVDLGPKLKLYDLNLTGIVPLTFHVPLDLHAGDGAAGMLGNVARGAQVRFGLGEVQNVADVTQGNTGVLTEHLVGVEVGALLLGEASRGNGVPDLRFLEEVRTGTVRRARRVPGPDRGLRCVQVDQVLLDEALLFGGEGHVVQVTGYLFTTTWAAAATNAIRGQRRTYSTRPSHRRRGCPPGT